MMVVDFTSVFPAGAKAVTAGSDHSILLQQDGTVWCTGSNLHGQLGDGSNTNRDSFVQVILGSRCRQTAQFGGDTR